MLLTLNNFTIDQSELTCEKTIQRNDTEALFADFLGQFVNHYIKEITPNNNDEFLFSLYSNESPKYSKLKISGSIDSITSDFTYYRYLFDFVDYSLSFNDYPDKELLELIYLSSLDGLIHISRNGLPTFGNNLEDVLLSILIVLGWGGSNSVSIVYLGEIILENENAHRFAIEIKCNNFLPIFDPDDII